MQVAEELNLRWSNWTDTLGGLGRCVSPEQIDVGLRVPACVAGSSLLVGHRWCKFLFMLHRLSQKQGVS